MSTTGKNIYFYDFIVKIDIYNIRVKSTRKLYFFAILLELPIAILKALLKEA